MGHAELKERARGRLAVIHDTQDSGVYAKMYAEDVKALLKALEEEEASLENQKSTC